MNNYTVDYLAHHGIMGMKWGVRRYQNPDGSLTPLGRKRYGIVERENAKASSSRSRIAKKYHAMNAEQMKAEIERSDNVKKAKGVSKKFSERIGYGSASTLLRGNAKGNARQAELSKTKFGKRYNEWQSQNQEYVADYFDYKKNSSIGRRIFDDLTGDIVPLMKTPYERMSGRTTTLGKDIIDKTFTLGMAGAILDAKYSNDQKKLYKNKEKVQKDFNSIVKKEEDAMQKYRKGLISQEEVGKIQKECMDEYDKIESDVMKLRKQGYKVEKHVYDMQ